MCGIVGYFGNNNLQDKIDIKKMCGSIDYRGPDNESFFLDKGIGLGHRRLSIIDTSDRGNQPMSNEDNSIWIVFNGEIYNSQDLKRELKQKHFFKSNTDTEIIIHSYEERGVEIFKELNGMFALAIYDKRKNKLILARDRMGQKPLYYLKNPGGIIFGSEPKVFYAFSDFKKDIDLESVSLYFLFQYLPLNKSMFKNVEKLAPGCFLIFDGSEKIDKYWELEFNNSSNQDKDIFGSLIEDSVRARLVSDVPLGVFLSGGLDSSTIAYYAVKNSSKKVKTFSIGFEDSSFDESQYAKEISDVLGTEHYHKYFSEKDFFNLVPKIFSLQDEPLADASILPTFLLSQFTKERVTVALSGDGADELFCGYPTFQAHKLNKIIPNSLKGIIAGMVKMMPVSHNNLSIDFKLKRFILGMNLQGYKKDISWMGAFDFLEQKELFSRDFFHTHDIENKIEDFFSTPMDISPENSLLNFWQKGYLVDDILIKLDRASMYNSLEARSPFLDYRLVKYINNLPIQSKIKGWQTKYLLKELMSDKLPKNIVYRQKKGFGIPLAKWLTGELKEFMLSSLDKEVIESIGFFNYKYIQTLLDDHLGKKEDNRMKIWTLLTFVEWYKRWVNNI